MVGVIILFVVTNLVCVPNRKELVLLSGYQEGAWKQNNNDGMEMGKGISCSFGNGKTCLAQEGMMIRTWFCFLFFLRRKPSRVLSDP